LRLILSSSDAQHVDWQKQNIAHYKNKKVGVVQPQQSLNSLPVHTDQQIVEHFYQFSITRILSLDISSQSA